MNEASPERGSYDIDEPTQPFSRTEIERMRQGADEEADERGEPRTELTVLDGEREGAEPGDDELEALETMPTVRTYNPLLPLEGPDWFELNGRRISISLEFFADFGQRGSVPGMIGAALSSCVAGEIGGPPDVPLRPLPRLTAQHRAAAEQPEPVAEPEPAPHGAGDEDLLALEAGLQRRPLRVAMLVCAIVLLGLGGWFVSRAPTDAAEPAPGEPVVISAAAPTQAKPEPEPVAVTPDLPSPDDETDETKSADEPNKSSASKQAKQRHRSDECVRHRKQADSALRDGKWTELLRLCDRSACWSSPRQANALCLRAMFELERYDECVKAASKARSKEEKKWGNNCKRALQ